jgi:hypothetical protein
LSLSLIFIWPTQASHPVEPTQASIPHCSTLPTEPDMVTLSSSDIEEALELLFSSPDHDHVSQVSKPSSCSGSDLFEDWPKANDTTASVYVALTADASCSHASTADAPCGDRESHTDSSSSQQSCSRATLLRRSRR